MAKRDLYDRNNIKNALKYNEAAKKSSERGTAILQHTVLECELEGALRASLREKSRTTDELFANGGALETFSAQAKLAYSLKIIDKDSYADLVLLARIRNFFAHQYSATYESDDVYLLVKKLSINNVSTEDGLLESIRDKSIESAHSMAMVFLEIELNNIWSP